MSRLEDLIHQTLVAHESEAPPGATLLQNVYARRGHRRAGVMVATAVAVAGVAAVIAVVTQVVAGDGRGPAQPLPLAPSGTSKVFPLPSDGWKPGDPALDALAIGPFHATRLQNGQVCAWLGTRFRPTLWPQGYHARLHPVQLLGPGGRVVAEAGDVLSTGGGGEPAPAGTPCAHAGQWTWSVMSVPRVTQTPSVGGLGTLVGHLYAVGGPAPGSPRGISGTITARGTNGSRTVKTSHDGGFRIQLPTGTYTLRGHSRLYNQGASPCTAPHSVAVKRDQTVSIDVLCQMK